MCLATLEKEFAHFLCPHPRVQTSGRLPNEPLLGVFAFWQGKPVGLVLAEKQGAENGLIVCWHVLKPQQGFGLGQKLIIKMEQFAKSKGIDYLTLSFRWDTSFRQQITKILHRLGWDSPEKELMLYKFSPKLFMQMAWCQNMRLPTEFEIFSWDILTKLEKQQILNRQEQSDWYPVGLSPLFDNPDFESANSLGLRLHGEVVGWMITHRVHADVIEYSSLFVSPELQSMGRGIHLIVEAVKRQYALGVERAIFQVQAENSAMLSFVERRMAETITAQTGRWFSKKSLF
jgi:GNAT superfamily N-acetyltransferase